MLPNILFLFILVSGHWLYNAKLGKFYFMIQEY